MNEIVFSKKPPEDVELAIKTILEDFQEKNRDAIVQIYVDWRVNRIDPEPRLLELVEKYRETNRSETVG